MVQLDDQNPIDSQRQETFCFRLGFLTISGANREPSLFQVRSIEKFQKASDQGAINYFILQLRAPQQETTHQVTLTDVFHHEVAIEDPDNLLQLTTPSNHLFFETKLKSAGNPVVD
ncbi:hypothetical protein [Lapidilactobacillus gannanensis]|uniref:Uncharacterized protein n=1 Tax=Lapidilactobacillus gannanensis TaxID=2486002 RepID=A0ABW4BMQ4_9LACO|nr:hypothetical protein [Lapidilactobacillus gannanensis]